MRAATSRVAGRIGDACFRDALLSARACITPTACERADRVVAAVRLAVIDAEARTESDDVGLAEIDQGRMDTEPTAAGRDLGERLERADELRSTIWIARRIEHVAADEQVLRAERLGPRERER